MEDLFDEEELIEDCSDSEEVSKLKELIKAEQQKKQKKEDIVSRIFAISFLLLFGLMVITGLLKLETLFWLFFALLGLNLLAMLIRDTFEKFSFKKFTFSELFWRAIQLIIFLAVIVVAFSSMFEAL